MTKRCNSDFYLDKGIWTEFHINDEALAIIVKLKYVDLILQDQITQTSFSKSNTQLEFFVQLPFNLAWVDILKLVGAGT